MGLVPQAGIHFKAEWWSEGACCGGVAPDYTASDE